MPPSTTTATPRIPSATYRVQFHKGFTFNQAREIVPYLAALGISDLYASPFFQATPGSTHGYDIVDHNHLNPEVGTSEEFDALCATLKKHGLGLVADFVPNHMGIAEATNGWWMDVLENGPSAAAARCFDIDWHPLKGELANKVLLPILGDQYGRVLENGELKVSFDAGTFFLHYYDHRSCRSTRARTTRSWRSRWSFSRPTRPRCPPRPSARSLPASRISPSCKAS